jgi:nucleoside-diphosphate-sugar epimerase
LLDSDIEGPVNIASGEPIKLMELIGLAAKECGRSDLVRLGALKPAADDPPLLLADTRRLFDEVGWQTQYSLQEGIRETVAWWKQKI